ncbi:hypothetical protein pb186bvf_016487 [Paramecium bursaria]
MLPSRSSQRRGLNIKLSAPSNTLRKLTLSSIDTKFKTLNSTMPQAPLTMSRFGLHKLPNINLQKQSSLQISRTSRIGSNFGSQPVVKIKTESNSPLLGSPNKETILLDPSKIVVHFHTETGCHNNIKKQQNQDTLLLQQTDQFSMFNVCDGHGQNGHLVSQYIARRLVEKLNQALISNQFMLQFNPHLYQSLIRNTFLKVDQELEKQNFSVFRSGSTANLVLLVQQTFIKDYNDQQNQDKYSSIYCANVGDSRAILVSKSQNDINYQIIQLSFDHRPDIQEERNRIVQKGGIIDTYRDQKGCKVGPARVWLEDMSGPGLAMSRSFGDRQGHSVGVISEPTIIEHKVRANDKFVIICSDGVWQYLSNSKVAHIVWQCYQQGQYEKAPKLIVEVATQMWKILMIFHV